MRIAFSIALIAIALLFMALVPALALDGQNGDTFIEDQLTDNRSMDSADIVDGFHINGEIGPHGDHDDWYLLQGQEGSNPTFTLTYNFDECDIDMNIYDGDQIVGALISPDSPDSGTYDMNGTCYLHVVYYFDGNGQYTIDIEPYGNSDESARENGSEGVDSPSSPGVEESSTIGDPCQGPDEVEPNNDEDSLNSIESLIINGHACPEDIDWFVLEGQTGTNPTITLSYNDSECDIDLDIYDVDGYVGSLTSPDSPDESIFNLHGGCWIMVSAYEGEGDYTIEIEP
jgi:hypothetical protein